MNMMSSEPSWIQRASNPLWSAILMSLRRLDVIIHLPAIFKFDEQIFLHSPIDSSSKPFVSLEQISNHSMDIEIIDPPIIVASCCLFDPTMEHVELQEVTIVQQSLRVYVCHKCINPNIVDNSKQPLTPRDGEQPSAPRDGLPIATNAATPTTDLEDAPSLSLDSIVIDFTMHATVDYLTLEPSIHQFGHVHTHSIHL
jgi:hypothetical protein